MFWQHCVNLQTAVAAILIFVECPKLIMFEVLLVKRPYMYQNVMSIWKVGFKLPHSQAISCIGYDVNLQTAVAAILIFVKCPKSIASAISKCEVNPSSGVQATAFTNNILHKTLKTRTN